MLTGIRMQAHPTALQELTLSQWMGCARFIWNAKCDEDRYFRYYAKKFCPLGVYGPLDQAYSHFKDAELSPWLFGCPSQILRNSASHWYKTYQNFLAGECGRPKCKTKDSGGSIHLTSELFVFEPCGDGTCRLFIGTKRNHIGCLAINIHGTFVVPRSIDVKKKCGRYWVSFCYDDGLDESTLVTQQEHLDYLRNASSDFLDKHTIGIDRGIVRPVQAANVSFDLTPEQKRSKRRQERHIKRYQRRLVRQKKGSRRRFRTKAKLARSHEKLANIRKDFCHKTSKAIVSHPEHKIIVLEDLQTKNMSARPKAKRDDHGRWQANGAAAKAGLHRAILSQGWHQFESFIKYKSYRAGKAWFKVSAYQTSQECADCTHTHPDKRKREALFSCGRCGHTENADVNAAKVIKKRAINLIKDSGTELSKRGILLGIGRGAAGKTGQAQACLAGGKEASKKRRRAASAA